MRVAPPPGGHRPALRGLAAARGQLDAGSNAPPSVQGRWVMTNEHGEVLLQGPAEVRVPVRAAHLFRESELRARLALRRAALDHGLARRGDPSFPGHPPPHARIHRAGRARPSRSKTRTCSITRSSTRWKWAAGISSEKEAARLREYLDRGGTLIVDDFHGSYEWAGFMESLPPRRSRTARSSTFPTTIRSSTCCTTSTIGRRFPASAPSIAASPTSRMDIARTGAGVYDDSHRLAVIINFNMDMGDAWENADNPDYPQPLTGIAYRFAINYLLYAMSH